jgi:hypothetical protein
MTTQVCASFPPTKPFFARYMPKLLSGNSQYIRAHSTRDQFPQPGSGGSGNFITISHTITVRSQDRGGSAGIEFEECSGRDNSEEKIDQYHTNSEKSQDWSWLNLPSSTSTSVEHLVPQDSRSGEV